MAVPAHQNEKTRKPNKMNSECAFEPLSTIQAIRYFSDIGKCERTHHTLALSLPPFLILNFGVAGFLDHFGHDNNHGE
jgi:hypothetical protein